MAVRLAALGPSDDCEADVDGLSSPITFCSAKAVAPSRLNPVRHQGVDGDSIQLLGPRPEFATIRRWDPGKFLTLTGPAIVKLLNLLG